MRKWVGLILALAVLFAVSLALADVNIAEAFPDEAFRQVAAEYDQNGDGILSTEEAAQAKWISCSFSGISDMTGVECFPNLISLSCGNNELTKLDLSSNHELVRLDCEENRLASLDVSGCAKLTRLFCYSNELKKLDVSGCPEMKELECHENRITSLNFTGCTQLETIRCDSNGIKKLNLESHPVLQCLICEANELSSLDLSGCPALTVLKCSWNNLSGLDLSGLPALSVLDCSHDGLKTPVFSACPTLTEITCDGNKFGSLEISGLPGLKKLSCVSCGLKTLDVSGVPGLVSLHCGGNSLTGLDVSALSALEELECGTNKLKSLTLGSKPTLATLRCEENGLKKLDLSGCPALTTISCQQNKITKLDVSKSAGLCNCVAKNKRVMGDGLPCIDRIGDSVTIDYKVTVKAGKKTSKPMSLYKKVREVVASEIKGGMSDRDKALALHEWLTHHACYDKTYTNHHPSGVLLQGAGVCQSYAEAYALLLNEVGIPNVLVTGAAGGEGHAWNYIRIDGRWWHVDVTWDDPYGYGVARSGAERQKYFMLTSEQISSDHLWSEALPGDEEGYETDEVTADSLKYKLNDEEKTAAVIGAEDRNAEKLTIPVRIKVNNRFYTVTEVGDGALKNLKKLKTLVIGDYVETIGKNAFSGCKKLAKITVKTKKLTMDSVGKDAFKNISKKAVFKCPKKQKAEYQKIFRKKGAPKKAKFK